MSSPAARIVVADEIEALDVFRRMVASPLPVASAINLREARQALQLPTALVVCGCHFDEGGMYDLLRHMKATPQLARVPFLAVRLLEGELDDGVYESINVAVRALGGDAFVDVPRWVREYGEAETGRRLAEIMASLLKR